MTRSIALLGSTGSIGRQTLEVARELGLTVAALTANRSVDLIEQQAREFSPRLAVLYDEDAARELRARLSDTKIQVLSGMEGLLAAATAEDADTVVTAVMGMIGLKPTLAAIEKKKRIALANKETLVCAGELVVDGDRARRQRAQRDLSVLAGLPRPRRDQALDPDLLGRAVLRFERTGARDKNEGGRAPTPQLDDGREDHHRLGDAHEQRP